MTIERKLLGTSPSGGATDVADVFSTQLYTGNATARSITNGIDLAGEGGMIWTKQRSSTGRPAIVDTERGNTKYLKTDVNGSQDTSADSITAFNSNGYNLGADTGSGAKFNTNNVTHVSWTFRKKEKFFDIVTWTGNSTAGRTVAHSLGSVPAMIFTKCTSEASNWQVFHKDLGHATNAALHAGTAIVRLDTNGDRSIGSSDYWQNTLPTSTHISLGGQGSAHNLTGKTYIAYVFADNTAEDAEEQMIKCGGYTGTGASVGASVTLGWEPQFVLVKAASAAGSWAIMDTMRGIPNDSDNPTLFADTSAAEVAQANWLEINSTGFKTLNGNYANGNASGVTYVYMAIRAPMMVEPEAATEVFEVDQAPNSNNPRYIAPFPIDMGMARRLTGDAGLTISSRKTMGQYIRIDNSAAEVADSRVKMDFSNGWDTDGDSSTAYYSWMWKRAKGFFDVVAYTGTGSNRTVPHSLGVVPEMIWVKRRNGSNGWFVYTAEGAGSSYLHLNENYNYSTNATGFNNTAATSSVFSVGTNHSTNRVSGLYIAYLFATLDGISKVGTYTGNGSSQTINCGFSGGSRFVIIKRANLSVSGNEGDWFMWDSLNGIVAGNDPHLSINTGTAQVTSDDSLDPANAGFIVNQVAATNINVSSHTYVFYAIA